MSQIRVMLVDDSVVIRRTMSELLSADPDIEVVATASTGRNALSKLARVSPDLVILDVEMPEMSGLEVLCAIRQLDPRLPVVMFSARCQRGASLTLDALSAGASDFVAKPSGAGVNQDASVLQARDELVKRIKLLVRRRPTPTLRATLPPRSATPVPLPPTLSSRSRTAPGVVAIGVSTGGPGALAVLLGGLPSNFQVPILIVQHMPPTFTRLLAERLRTRTSIPVHEAEDGIEVVPGNAYLARGDLHMEVERDGTALRIRTRSSAPENSCRPAVDVLFRSVAQVYGRAALGVILTGMGQDGLRGCEGLRAAGGQILIQDEASSVVWGMPGAVARAGLADQCLPLELLAGEILRRVTDGRSLSDGLRVGNL